MSLSNKRLSKFPEYLKTSLFFHSFLRINCVAKAAKTGQIANIIANIRSDKKNVFLKIFSHF